MFNLEHKALDIINEDIALDQQDEWDNEDNEDRKENINNKIFALKNVGMNEHWIAVRDIYNKDRRDILEEKYGKNFSTENKEKNREYEDKIIEVKNILKIKIPAIILNENLKYEDATDIFRRINSKGSKLNGTDLALAILALKWNDCTEEFDNLLQDDLGDYGIDYLMIIRQLSIIATDQCKYSAFEKLNKDTIQTAFIQLKEIYKKVYDIMKNTFCIENLSLLPSKYPFYLLCYLNQKFPDEFQKNNKLKQWFFSFNAFGVYSSSSETRLQQHIDLVKNSTSLDEVLLKLTNKAQIKAIDSKYLEENNTTNSSIFGILYFIQRADECKDWVNSNIMLSYSNKWAGYNKEVHHIFPKSLLTIEKNKINDIANLTFITSETNKKISNKEPIKYFEDLGLFDKNKMKGHFIPLDNKEILKIANYEEFLKQRRELLADRINTFLGLKNTP